MEYALLQRWKFNEYSGEFEVLILVLMEYALLRNAQPTT